LYRINRALAQTVSAGTNKTKRIQGYTSICHQLRQSKTMASRRLVLELTVGLYFTGRVSK